jgi:hypothetical protein
VDAVEAAIKTPLSGSQRRLRPGGGLLQVLCATPAANMLTVAAAVVYVFSIAATRACALLLQRNIVLSTEKYCHEDDNNSKITTYSNMQE